MIVRPTSILTLLALSSFGLMNAQVTEEQREFSYFENSEIYYQSKRWLKSYSYIEGTYTVFEFKTDNAGDPGNHSKAESIIAFQVPNNLTELNITNEEIEAHGGLYMQTCRCQDQGIQAIRSGNITGRKTKNGDWEIHLNIVVIGNRSGKQYHIDVADTYQKSAT